MLTTAHAAALLLVLLPALTWGQTYPGKPIRMVVPFAAGGVVDTTARALGPRMGDGLGQPVIIDNRPGAGGNIAADVVAKAPADGYTLLITTHGHAISPGLYKKLPFDAGRDFAPITQVASSYLVLVASLKVPASSVKELLALARANPGRLNYGSTGLGAPPHLVGELFKMTTGIDMVHVPYKGDAPMYVALLAGEVDVAFGPLGNAIQHIRSGKLRALAMTNPRRSAAIPEVPTMAEAGVPNFELTGWLGLFAPAGTPRAVVDRLYREMLKTISSPEIRERMPAWGYEPVGTTPDEFDARFKSDLALYARVIREARIPLQD
jgi:tripartite-type tricarboxylate transporter receptor subunit TctC